jgi:hypothetical protein
LPECRGATHDVVRSTTADAPAPPLDRKIPEYLDKADSVARLVTSGIDSATAYRGRIDSLIAQIRRR